MKIFCFAVMLLLLFAGPAQAQSAPAQGQKPAFFEALYDVPVMPGLEERKDQTMVFDKPDGKIATVSAFSKERKGAQILTFYTEILPQFGWKKTNKNQYVRDKEQLELIVTDKQAGTDVQFTLSPAP